MRKYNNFIAKHELFDLPLNGATYTWTNNQFNSIRSRIDRILVSAAWEQQFPRVVQQVLSRHCSDHNPVTLFCDGVKTGPGPFRCESLWYAHPDFIFFISTTWFSFVFSGGASFSLYKKLQLINNFLDNGVSRIMVIWTEEWRN